MTTLQEQGNSTRIQSIDILRGAVIVLMAVDHVRVYSGLPAGSLDPPVFFTRWITHFCAPAFVFFAGTGAFLNGKKSQDIPALSRFLLSRGALLVFLELTLIRFGWTFNFNYADFTLAGVIWMLGWCMVALSLLVKMRPMVVGGIGIAIIFLQKIFALFPSLLPEQAKATVGGLWEFVYSSGTPPLPGISILYVLIPWIGVMAAGYGFGIIMSMEKEQRRKYCLWIGLSATALFTIIGTLLILLKPNPAGPPFIFQLLNQQKYPASQLYLMMTLGPMIALIPWAERANGKIADALKIFGGVPLFYYLLHIPLIHVSALAVNYFLDGSSHQEWYGTAPFSFVPETSRWPLPLLYLVFAVDIVILFALCRWYARYKSEHPGKKWLKYV